MFDFGFWELTIIMVIALLVVGPERLPSLAGQVGRWVGKAKRIVRGLRSDIESEIKAAELKEMLQKQQNEIGELKEIINSTKDELVDDFDGSMDEENQNGDHELIKAVEKHIESTKQQAKSGKNETD